MEETINIGYVSLLNRTKFVIVSITLNLYQIFLGTNYSIKNNKIT